MPALHFHGITARQYYGYTNSFRLFVTAMKGMGSVSITSTCSVYCQVGTEEGCATMIDIGDTPEEKR